MIEEAERDEPRVPAECVAESYATTAIEVEEGDWPSALDRKVASALAEPVVIEAKPAPPPAP